MNCVAPSAAHQKGLESSLDARSGRKKLLSNALRAPASHIAAAMHSKVLVQHATRLQLKAGPVCSRRVVGAFD